MEYRSLGSTGLTVSAVAFGGAPAGLTNYLSAYDPDDPAHFTPWALIHAGARMKPFACLFEPPTLDARLAAQSAVFTKNSGSLPEIGVFAFSLLWSR